jgi:hypothetical protein
MAMAMAQVYIRSGTACKDMSVRAQVSSVLVALKLMTPTHNNHKYEYVVLW